MYVHRNEKYLKHKSRSKFYGESKCELFTALPKALKGYQVFARQNGRNGGCSSCRNFRQKNGAAKMSAVIELVMGSQNFRALAAIAMNANKHWGWKTPLIPAV